MTTKITALGFADDFSGLGNAFLRNVQVLKCLSEVQIVDARGKFELGEGDLYVHLNPRALEMRWPRFGPQLMKARGRRIAYWVCESGRLTNDFRAYAHFFDEIWTASSFCAEVFRQELGVEAKIVPHYIHDFELRKRDLSDGFCFLQVFNAESRFMRKNPFLLLKAFEEAFGKRSKHELVMKVSNAPQCFERELLRMGKGLNFKLITDELEWYELRELYRKAHFVVSPHAGEGFGLTLLEGMGFGAVPICTGWSGTEDFVEDRVNGFKVEYKLVEPLDKFFAGYWAEPDQKDLTQKMQLAISDSFHEMSKRAFETALEFNSVATLKKVYELWK